MKKLMVVILIVMHFGFISNLSASDTIKIDNPKIKGIALDWCKTWGVDCGKPAADYFCKYKGYEESILFEEEHDIGYTRILKTGQICNDKFCDSFKFITCKKQNYKRFLQPKYKKIALDWCYIWGHECGSKPANEYCKIKGYTKGVLRFEIENDIGYTIIMRTGQICSSKFCDSFKYIDCKK